MFGKSLLLELSVNIVNIVNIVKYSKYTVHRCISMHIFNANFVFDWFAFFKLFINILSA